MFKKISRLLVSLTLVVLMGITMAIPTGAASEIKPSKSLKALVPHTAIFDPQQVRLGITPTGWSNSDDLTIDLDPPISAKQIMSEIALSGYKGTQGAPKFPSDVTQLKKDLDVRDLTISEPWVGTYFSLGPAGAQESYRILDEQMEFMSHFDSNVIVVAELGGAVHQQPIDPLTNRPFFSDQQWTDLLAGLNELGRRAVANNMILCYHPHVGTGVETAAEIDRLMAGTDPHYVNLLLDTGHISYAMATEAPEVDPYAVPLEVTKKYRDRIKHVHLKNIRANKLMEVVNEGTSFLNAIRAGVFTVPGDNDGAIDFEPILEELSLANYQGWLMVEAEQDPNTTMTEYGKEPLEYALMARDYLRQVTGL
ncbi:MAG: TIM barrel protein [Crocosphaera sp.]